MTAAEATPRRRTALAKAHDDVAHLAAFVAVLYGEGAVLVDTRPGKVFGGWMLRIQTVDGPVAYPIRDQDLTLFDRVTRVGPDDPRARDVSEAAAHRNERVAVLTDTAWIGGGAFNLRARDDRERT